MSKAINVRLSSLTFPNTCVVCLSPSTKEYELEATFSYGRRSYTVKARVPMCEMHFEAASYKGPAERFVNWFAVFGGILAGLTIAAIAVMNWESPEPLLVKLFGGGLFGFGVFAIFWWVVSASIAPIFASAHSKEARRAVRITHYWPNEKVAQLTFEHESLADIVQKSN